MSKASANIASQNAIRFVDLEADICDTGMAAQILATLFEEAERDIDTSAAPIPLYKAEADQIRFMIYDLCGRTQRLQKAFYRAHEAEHSKRGEGQ